MNTFNKVTNIVSNDGKHEKKICIFAINFFIKAAIAFRVVKIKN